MYRFNEFSSRDEYAVIRKTSYDTEYCAIVGQYYKEYHRGLSFHVSNKEGKNLTFYTHKELEDLVMTSKMSVDIAKRELKIGDLVVGYGSNRLYMGMYMGKKVIYTINGEISCSEVYLIEPQFLYEDEKQLIERLKKLYVVSNEANLKAKYADDSLSPGDIVCSSSKNLYWYLGKYEIDTESYHVYLNFSVTSLKQEKFLDFIKGKNTCSLSYNNYDYRSKICVSDLKLKALLFSVFYACSGKFLVSKKIKPFSTFIHHIDMSYEESKDFKFKKLSTGAYMLLN